MNESRNFQLFFMSAFFFLAVVMLVMNDVMSVWEGAETQWISMAQQNPGLNFPAVIVGNMPAVYFPFFQRLPGVLIILVGLAGFYGLGWRIFGREATLLTILLLSGTFLIATLGKLATLDCWVFTTQLLALISLIRFVKEPKLIWRVLSALLLLGALWLEPLGTLILGMSFSLWIFFRHPQGKNLLQLHPWGILIIGLLIAYLFNFLHWRQPAALLGFFQISYSDFLLYSMLALLPIIGFCLGGLRDLFFKLRRGEELANILVIWILGAILAESAILQVGFCLLAAKQIQSWNNPKYPFQNWVKTGAILHVIAAFGIGFYLMTKGFVAFGPAGFRAGLAITAAYWTFSLAGVVGLYAQRRNLLIAGPVLSGLIGMLFFWVWAYPPIESKRLPYQAIIHLEAMDTTRTLPLVYCQNEGAIPLSLQVKMDQLDRKVLNWDTVEDKTDPVAGIYFYPVGLENQVFNQPPDSSTTIQLWRDNLQGQEWKMVNLDLSVNKVQ